MNTALIRRAALGLTTVSLAGGLLNVFARPAAAQDDGPMGTAVATTTTAPIPFSQTLEYQDELKAGHITPALDRVVKNMERFYTAIQGDKIRGDDAYLYKGELFNPLDNDCELAVDNKVYAYLTTSVYNIFCMDEEKPDPRIQPDMDNARDAYIATTLCKSQKLKLGFAALAEDIIQTRDVIAHLGERDEDYRYFAIWVPTQLNVSEYKDPQEKDKVRTREALGVIESKGVFWLPSKYYEYRGGSAEAILRNLAKHGENLPERYRVYAEENLSDDPIGKRIMNMKANVFKDAFDYMKTPKFQANLTVLPKLAAVPQ